MHFMKEYTETNMATQHEEVKYVEEEDVETVENAKKGKKRLKKKFTFVLKDIDPSAIDSKYGLNITSNLREKQIPDNVTSIDQLTSAHKDTAFIPFIDESRKHCVTMIDSIQKKSIQAHYCFWCRHAFATYPIGCPLRYVTDKVVQMHISEITKEKYYIVHQVTSDADTTSENTKSMITNYYETDGCFCSFNCCLSYIHSNIQNPMYMNSKRLLMKMYSEIFNTEKLVKIFPAPSWRLLKQYGGFMDIQEFRNSFKNYIYIDHKYHITKIPKIMPVGHIFEEHIIF